MEEADIQTEDKVLTGRVQFWTLLGPWLIVATVLVAVLKPEAPSTLAFLAVGGMLVCWKYRMGGLWFSLAAIILFELITLSSVQVHERFWYVGTGISLALALAVTTMALEEIRELAERLSIESDSRLEALVQADDRLKVHEQAWKEERQAFLDKAKEDQEVIISTQRQLQTFQRMITFIRKDLELADETQARLKAVIAEKEEIINGLLKDLARKQGTVINEMINDQ